MDSPNTPFQATDRAAERACKLYVKTWMDRVTYADCFCKVGMEEGPDHQIILFLCKLKLGIWMHGWMAQ